MTQSLSSPQLPNLPRITSYGLEAKQPLAKDFFRRMAPFLGRVNVWLERVMVVLAAVALVLLMYLGLFAALNETYVTDGTNACKTTSVPKVERAGRAVE
jgi:hypothetical protein